MVTIMTKLILASASPRRKELLNQIGLDFEVYPSNVKEEIPFENPVKYATDLALLKAKSVADIVLSGVILAADTIVLYNDEILQKPYNEENAKEILKKLSGDTHQVITGIALIDVNKNKIVTKHSVTKVYFKRLSEEMITKYIATGEPFDKAGAYGIQGFGACLVDKIEGCYFNVVGLPISKLVDCLPSFGIGVFRS